MVHDAEQRECKVWISMNSVHVSRCGSEEETEGRRNFGVGLRALHCYSAMSAPMSAAVVQI